VCPSCLAPLCGFRKSAGLTQVELAGRAKCAVSTIVALERDRYHPQLVLAERLAGILARSTQDVFPHLEITKAEAQAILGMTGRTLNRLCDEGVLPASVNGSRHRFPYSAVVELALVRGEWVNFHAACEEEPELEWWLLSQWQAEGLLEVVVDEDGSLGRRGGRFVRRADLAATVEAVRASMEPCPLCNDELGPLPLGRKSHAECRGPLGSKAYWPNTSEAIRLAHGERVKHLLDDRPIEAKQVHYWRRINSLWAMHRSPEQLAEAFYAYWGSTKAFGWAARSIAASSGKSAGRQANLHSSMTDEKRERILRLHTETWPDGSKRHSVRAIARMVDASRGSVEHVIRSAKVS
jgi:DNA-binding XRE family transcriptional regulator